MPFPEFVHTSEGNKRTTVMFVLWYVLYKLQVWEVMYSKVVKHEKTIPRTTKLRYRNLAVRDDTYQ